LGVSLSVSNTNEEFGIFAHGDDSVLVEINGVERIGDGILAVGVAHVSEGWDQILDGCIVGS
jgi:sporulation protein YlmC with PRC-barrel domain